MKTKLSAHTIDRLRGTQTAVNADTAHFNPNLWVSPPDSKKYAETCGDFAWFACEKYGTPEQRARFAWDKANDWVGKEILGLPASKSNALFWGGNTLEVINDLIDKWEDAYNEQA
jgi:hypothetical protein